MFDASHRAMQREAQLSAEQISQGITALGKATFAQTGLYNQAFFGLSIGLERMGKLIVLADYAIKNSGAFPTDGDLRRIGHELRSLLSKCEKIGHVLDPARDFKDRPSDPIHHEIEGVLSLFATKLRYYNLSHLAGAAANQKDPVALWWKSVAEPICDRHYPKHRREKNAAKAEMVEQLYGDAYLIRHTAEDGTPIDNLRDLGMRTEENLVAQRYGRLYTLQIVRWLTSIIRELACRGAYQERIEALLGLEEPFRFFYNEDKLLRNRKRWSIYSC